MKYILILATALLVMSGCTTQYQATNYDDVYFSPKNQPAATQHAMIVNTPEADANAYKSTEQAQPQEEQPVQAEVNENQDSTYYTDDQQYATNNNVNADNGYNEDNYYDYAYSARLR